MNNNSWETSLPISLQKNTECFVEIKNFVEHWARLVCWSWTEILAFKEEAEKKQEQTLKEFFIKTLQNQGQNTYAYQSYADGNALEIAKIESLNLKNLILGNNSEIEDEDLQGVEVTLSNVLQKLYKNEKFELCSDNFKKIDFEFRTIVDYTGKIIEISENKYIAYLAYPPRPTLSQYTITEDQLNYWVINRSSDGNYLPPSIYIPIAGT